MLQRNLHLAMAGVIAVGLALGVLAFHYRDLTINAAQETKFRDNQEIARALSAANWTLVEALLNPPAGLSRDELRNRAEVAQLRDVVDDQIRSGVLTKIKIYDLSGLTLFSTAEAQIGEDYSHIREIDAARDGLSVTRIKQRPMDSPGAGPEESVSSIESYIPLRDPKDGSIRGIYEIYANITPFLQRISEVEDRMLFGILEVAALYALLVLLFWRFGRESRFAQEFLDAVFENHPDMLLAKDARNLRYVRANKAARRALGESRELIGKLDRDCFPRAQAAFFSAQDREVLDSRQALDIPATSVETKDRGPRTLRLRKVPIGPSSGMRSLILAIVEDITDQQQALLALRSSEERFRQVIDHAGDALLLHTPDGRFVEANRQACVSLGYTREELLGLRVPDVEVSFEPGGTGDDWGLKNGQPQTVKGVHRRKDGTTFPVEVRLAPVSLGGEPGVIAIARDITQRVEAEQEAKLARERAEIASQEKSDYIGRLGHGLRTPLHAVIGMTDLLSTTRLTRKQASYIETIRASGELLGTLINDTLDFARLEAGAMRLEEVEFSVGAVIEGVVGIMGYRAYEKGLELVCLFEADVTVPLTGDPDRLREVLINLVGNAVKFTHQGTVTLSVSRVEDTGDALVFRFTVQDTGIGVSRQGQATLFTPFSQVHTGNQAAYQGSGLGLSISKKLVEAMGGSIGFESQLGKGSSFWFELPFRRAEGAAPQDPGPSLESRRVLSVARHPALRQMLCHQLHVWRMRCDTVTEPREALALLGQDQSETGPYEYAILDLDRQEKEVIALARRIRSDPALASLRVILLSSVAHPIGVGVVSSLGGVVCLDKPVLPSRLRAALLDNEARDDAEAPVISDSRVPPPRGSGERRKASILVAEDNPVSRQMLMEMLDTLGYEAEAVADGSAALAAAVQKHYDALLLDCQMPGLDGYQVAADLSRREAETRPLLIAITADVSTSNLNRCKTAGMDKVLTKPLRLRTLEKKLEQCLSGGHPGRVQPSTSDEPPEADAAPIDPGVWNSLLETERRRPGFLGELVRLFARDVDSRLQAIASDIADGHPDKVLRDVHALRAGCLQIGATGMAELSKQLHQAAKAGEAERVAGLYARLRDESEQVRQFLHSESERLGLGNGDV